MILIDSEHVEFTVTLLLYLFFRTPLENMRSDFKYIVYKLKIKMLTKLELEPI